MLKIKKESADTRGYWDFVYFGAGATTTPTFGDIASNSSSVRMLVCLQELGSIVFSGLMIRNPRPSSGRAIFQGSTSRRYSTTGR
jgi:uncharacterized membrane protein